MSRRRRTPTVIVNDVRSMILQDQEWKDENQDTYRKSLRLENEIMKAAACWRFTLAAKKMPCAKCKGKDGTGAVRFRRPVTDAPGLENEPENLIVLCATCRGAK